MQLLSIFAATLLLLGRVTFALDPVSPFATPLSDEVKVVDGPDGVEYGISWRGCTAKLWVNKVDKKGAARNGRLTLCDREIREIEPPLLALFKKDRQSSAGPLKSIACPGNIPARESFIQSLMKQTDWDATTGKTKSSEPLNDFVARVYGKSKSYRDIVDLLLRAGYVTRSVSMEKIFATDVSELRKLGLPLKGLSPRMKALEPSMCTLTLDTYERKSF